VLVSVVKALLVATVPLSPSTFQTTRSQALTTIEPCVMFPLSRQTPLNWPPSSFQIVHASGARVAGEDGFEVALTSSSSQKIIWISAISSSLVGWWAVPPSEPLRGGTASPSVPGAWVPPIIPSEVPPWGWWEALGGPSPPSHLFQSKPFQRCSSLRLLSALSATDVL
jgi:hypothetical protein